jgi:hypothetical protein
LLVAAEAALAAARLLAVLQLAAQATPGPQVARRQPLGLAPT